MAASSRLTSRTVPPSHAAGASRRRRRRRVPKPPTMMLAIERFMASAMSLVRIAPDAPTRAPEMISTGLLMTKPAIAAAVPVNELSSEMTTGMSAPPMGSTSVMPKISAGSDDQAKDAELNFVVSVIEPAAASTRTRSRRRQ